MSLIKSESIKIIADLLAKQKEVNTVVFDRLNKSDETAKNVKALSSDVAFLSEEVKELRDLLSVTLATNAVFAETVFTLFDQQDKETEAIKEKIEHIRKVGNEHLDITELMLKQAIDVKLA